MKTDQGQHAPAIYLIGGERGVVIHPSYPIRGLEETVTGRNLHPTPFVWDGKHKQPLERVRLLRLGGSGASLVNGFSFVV